MTEATAAPSKSWMATIESCVEGALRYLANALIPKRKTFVRAVLCGMLAGLPLLFVLTVTAWRVMLPLWVVIGMAARWLGLTDDVRKQLRWMRKMSMRGPIPGLVRMGSRRYHRGKRWYYGDVLDVMPVAPTVVGTKVRMTNAAMLKWLIKPISETSREQYEVQLRPTVAAETEWAQAGSELIEQKLAVGDLQPDTEYAVRVRAFNSKGSSEWCEATFRTKQEPVDGGGTGPGYTWTQGGKKADELTVLVALPAGTRAKQLSVVIKPSHLSISLAPPTGGDRTALVEGELFAAVKHEDIEWELSDEGAAGKKLRLALLKLNPQGPFWPSLVRGHPEVEVSGMKKPELSTEELMEQIAELQRASPGGMGGMGGMGGSMMDGMTDISGLDGFEE